MCNINTRYESLILYNPVVPSMHRQANLDHQHRLRFILKAIIQNELFLLHAVSQMQKSF